MIFLLDAFLKRFIHCGNLSVFIGQAKGNKRAARTYGDGTGTHIAVRVLNRRWAWRLARNPALALGEAYMEGGLLLEKGTLSDFMTLIGMNVGMEEHGLMRLLTRLRIMRKRLTQYNPRRRARANVAHHYDIDEGIYDLFLDSEKYYSCAYFEHSDMSLEDAQSAKACHIATKLRLKPGMRVLDIGCGWGSLAFALVKEHGVHVHGVTLSKNQCAYAQKRARELGLEAQTKFELRDYREIDGRYDRIVSVGMFEHVGIVHYKTFFAKLRALLEEDGIALVHSIGSLVRPDATNPWVARYIFPGGYIPSLSEVFPSIERAGLLTCDVEILREHYALTLAAWRARFTKNRAKAAQRLDERFCRMWEFYLNAAEASFRYRGQMVFQILMTRHIDTLPITRDFMREVHEAVAAQ